MYEVSEVMYLLGSPLLLDDVTVFERFASPPLLDVYEDVTEENCILQS